MNEPRPRTMPVTFARQGETIKRLQGELLDAKTLLRKAAMRLEGLNMLNVSVRPDVLTEDLVKGIKAYLDGDAAKG